MASIYYDNEKEVKNATCFSDRIGISINGHYVTEAKNTKTIREQVSNMMVIEGMDCVALTTYRDSQGKTAIFWFATPEFEGKVKDTILGIYGNPEDKCRTYRF